MKVNKAKEIGPAEKLKLQNLKDTYEELSQKRERNVNKYVIPIEIKMEKIRHKIDEIEL